MSEQTNRRTVVKAIAVGSASLALGRTPTFAQAAKEVKIGELKTLEKDYDSTAFDYDGAASLLVRVPAPAKEDARIMEADKDKKIYLTAYTLVCTHAGCKPGAPNKDHQLVCPCHGSTYNADGTVVKGPAKLPLAGLKLEVRQGVVYAVGKMA